MKNKRQVPMINEYEQIYRDWINEVKRLGFTADTPVTRVVLEMQKALRRVLQGTQETECMCHCHCGCGGYHEKENSLFSVWACTHCQETEKHE